jgi:ATP-binding cassette, subfamily B, bacterial
MNLFFLIWRHSASNRKLILSATSYSILNKIFDIAPPLLIGLAVDVVTRSNNSLLTKYIGPDAYKQLLMIALLSLIIWVL